MWKKEATIVIHDGIVRHGGKVITDPDQYIRDLIKEGVNIKSVIY